jgi:N-acetylglucosaminyldiphosphoundecaprenol N-acetyl-beta-D-mannosaminyltransferase
VLMKPGMHVSKFLARIELGDLDLITDFLIQKPALFPTFVWTMNLSHYREVTIAPDAYAFLESNSLIVADGWPVKYLVKVFESRKVNRIPGVDIVDALLTRGIRFCVVGSNQDQVLKTLKLQHRASSDLTFVYDEHIDIDSEMQVDEIVRLLLKFKPQFIFLALGFPKQEVLFEKIRIKNPLFPAYFLGIGGSFQMLSGEKVRAPRTLQNLGLEWLWRLSQDPRRLFSRYFADGKFFFSLAVKREAKRGHDFLIKLKG